MNSEEDKFQVDESVVDNWIITITSAAKDISLKNCFDAGWSLCNLVKEMKEIRDKLYKQDRDSYND